ncbi:hypothetical protein ACFL2S_05605 [Thermodesulfobacteriota bacterium]
MSNYIVREHSRRCGQIIMNFVNAKFTDEACHQLIAGIQQVYNVSSDFSEKAIKAFPNIDEFLSSLTKQERTLFNYFWKEENLIDSVHEELYSLNYEYEDHDCQKRTLTFWEITWRDDLLEGDNDFITNRAGPITKRIDELNEPNGESMPQEILKKIRNLLEIGIKIQKLKDRILEKRYCEIKTQSEYYGKCSSVYESISYRRNKLKKILNDIVKGKALSKNKLFDKFLDSYDFFCPQYIEINSDDTLVYNSHFFKEAQFLNLDSGPNEMNVDWPRPYHAVILYFFFEFLKISENKKLIHKCDECEKFFISKTARKQRFCPGNKCRLSYHNRKRIRSGEAKEYKRKKRKEGAKGSYYG